MNANPAASSTIRPKPTSSGIWIRHNNVAMEMAKKAITVSNINQEIYVRLNLTSGPSNKVPSCTLRCRNPGMSITMVMKMTSRSPKKL